VSRLDFASATEHAVEGFDDAAWERTREVARRLDDPGVFTTLLGYHWRDRLVILPGDDGPILAGDDRRSDQPGELMAALREGGMDGAVVIALDSASGGEAAGVEIYSWRNRSARTADSPRRFEPGPGWLTDAAQGPLPVSLVASSATHWGNPGTDDRTGLEPGAGGLTAVRTHRGGGGREAILDALRSGAAWATTGPRIYVALGPGEGGLRVTVAGERTLAEVALVIVERGRSSETALLEEPADQIDTTIPFPSPGHPAFCFLRVKQVDGEMAWSGPLPISRPH
jgi:hypothetical protein